jgi:hypothetical protein
MRPAKEETQYAFVAMPMNLDDFAQEAVLDVIKAAARRCRLRAERIDDQRTSEPIPARIRESIAAARVVIADITHEKGNVYFEVGYASGLNKAVVYVAREGSRPVYDVQDYPVIFFSRPKQLKAELVLRLRALLGVG